MARFDVARNRDGTVLLDVQASALSMLDSRVVVPLIPVGNASAAMKGLNPVLLVGGEPHVMMTQLLSAVPATLLREPIDNLDDQWDPIMRALDPLLTGF